MVPAPPELQADREARRPLSELREGTTRRNNPEPNNCAKSKTPMVNTPNTKKRLDDTPKHGTGLRQSRTREKATQNGRNRKGEAQNGMEEAQQRQLPADDASTDEVSPEAWQHKITPRDFYAEVEADPRAQKRVQTALAEIHERQATLAQVRKARAFTQATLAELLEIDQSEVSRLEHRSNMLLSTLRSFIRATGGELQLIATFPDAEPIQLLVGYETADIDS